MATERDRVAFITGGGSGIGAACAEAFVRTGWRVMVADRDVDGARRVAAALGAAACEIDVTDPDSADLAVAETSAILGGIDAAVNSAGVGVPALAPVAKTDPSDWRTVLSVNLDGVFFSMRSEIGAMVCDRGGSIVNLASVYGAVGTAGASSYVAAKHGVVGLIKAAAVDYAARGIRINAVGPGHVRTPMFERHSAQWQADTSARYPVGRVAESAEVVALILHLAGPEAEFLTGTFYPVDGGYLAQ